MAKKKFIFEKNDDGEEKGNLRHKVKRHKAKELNIYKNDKKVLNYFFIPLLITAWSALGVAMFSYFKNKSAYKLKINESSNYQEKINNFKEEIKNDMIKRCLNNLNECNLKIKTITEIKRNCLLDSKRAFEEESVKVFSQEIELKSNKKVNNLSELVSEVAEIAGRITKSQEQLIDEEIKTKEDLCKKEIKVEAIIRKIY
jgi:hypothetical protein